MRNLSSEVETKIERPLFELVKIRASQMNGCAYSYQPRAMASSAAV